MVWLRPCEQKKIEIKLLAKWEPLCEQGFGGNLSPPFIRKFPKVQWSFLMPEAILSLGASEGHYSYIRWTAKTQKSYRRNRIVLDSIPSNLQKFWVAQMRKIRSETLQRIVVKWWKANEMKIRFRIQGQLSVSCNNLGSRTKNVYS